MMKFVPWRFTAIRHNVARAAAEPPPVTFAAIDGASFSQPCRPTRATDHCRTPVDGQHRLRQAALYDGGFTSCDDVIHMMK